MLLLGLAPRSLALPPTPPPLPPSGLLLNISCFQPSVPGSIRPSNGGLLCWRLGSHTSAAPRHGHGGPRPFTRSNRFTPPGILGGPGRSRATRSPPDRLGPTRSTGGSLGSGQLGSVPRSHPCSAKATRIPAEHTARADSDPSVQSHHMTLTTTTPPGPGYIPPARVHAPAGQAQSSICPRLRTQQATAGVRRGYHDKAYVEARLKLYVQRTLALSYTGRESHTMAPAVWHTVPS
jgi:hypothetical protein